MHKYLLEVNLSRWAMIQFSSYIWKQLEMKRHLIRTSTGCPILPEDTVPLEIREKLDKLPLPRRQKDELKFAVGSMGTRIRNWLVTHAYGKRNETAYDFTDYVDHIHWTHLGCIDLTETNRSLYTSGLLPVTYGTWWRLCHDCNAECISDLWEKIAEDERYSDLMIRICSVEFGKHTACYYWRLFMQNKLDEFHNEVENIENSIDESMFHVYFNDNIFNTFLYFWNRLDEDQKKRMLEKQRRWLIRTVLFVKNQEDYWLQDWTQDTDSFMFVLEQYCLYGFDEFLVDMLRSSLLLGKMLVTWPCQENFMPALEDAWRHHEDIDYEPIMAQVLNFMDLEKAYLGDNAKGRKLFLDLWNKGIPGFRRTVNRNLLRELWAEKDLELLKYIVVHQDSWMERERVLDHLASFYVFEESSLTDWTFLEQFICEVSKDVDVREWFEMVLTEEDV